MPDLQGIPAGPGGAQRPQPAAGATGAQPSPPQPSKALDFRARLEAKVAARRAQGSIPPEHVADLIRLMNERGEAFESARLITKYPITERDDALYEVRTDRGVHRVIRGRDGSQTIFG
jgi:hypothetical protein